MIDFGFSKMFHGTEEMHQVCCVLVFSYVWTCMYICMYIHLYVYVYVYMYIHFRIKYTAHIHEITGLFCKRALQKCMYIHFRIKYTAHTHMYIDVFAVSVAPLHQMNGSRFSEMAS